MLYMPRTASASPERLADTFKEEIASVDLDEIPLQQGMSRGSVALGDDLSAMVIRVEPDEERVRVHAGLFFSSIVAGCACANDPTPENEDAEYIEAVFDIRRPDGVTTVTLSESAP